jgi:hypothetical protein
MSVAGSWNPEAIRSSYELSSMSLELAILVSAAIGLLIGCLGGKARVSLVTAWGVSVISALIYVLLVNHLAHSLCVEAPLDIKANGVVMVPFFLGTRGVGLSILGALFLTANGVGLSVRRRRTLPRLLMPSVCLLQRCHPLKVGVNKQNHSVAKNSAADSSGFGEGEA